MLKFCSDQQKKLVGSLSLFIRKHYFHVWAEVSVMDSYMVNIGFLIFIACKMWLLVEKTSNIFNA